MKMFTEKIEKCENIKQICHRCFLYFVEMFYMVTFMVADTAEVVSLKDILCRQLAKSLHELEEKENKLESLSQTLRATTKSREFLFERCDSLETKVNTQSMMIVDFNRDKKTLEAARVRLQEELQAKEKQIAYLTTQVNNMVFERVKYQKARANIDNMANVLTEIYMAVADVEEIKSPESELFSAVSN